MHTPKCTSFSTTAHTSKWLLGGLAIATVIGAAVLFPVLFACTLPEAKTIENAVKLDCTFIALQATSRYCCEHHWSQCDGCSALGQLNGGCSALKFSLDKNPHGLTIGNNTSTECCDGTCCAEHRTECEMCESESCTTDSKGRQTCSRSYYECNCETYCVRHSSRKGNINCGTCHDYQAGFQFTLDGTTHESMRQLHCGLDDTTGKDHHKCQAETMAAQAPGQTQVCWVNRETLEVSWEQPTWTEGCWAGIAIGGLFLLPLALVLLVGLLFLIGGMLHGCAQAVHQATASSSAAAMVQAGHPEKFIDAVMASSPKAPKTWEGPKIVLQGVVPATNLETVV